MIDENIPLVIAQALRDNGIDALHVEEADLKGEEDVLILRVAAIQRRIVVTRDVKDYIRLAGLFRDTGHDLEGILLVGHRIPAAPPRILIQALLEWTLAVQEEPDRPGYAVQWLPSPSAGPKSEGRVRERPPRYRRARERISSEISFEVA
ncbi:MAG: DUF5615 family PIN-like protein [bacterium]